MLNPFKKKKKDEKEEDLLKDVPGVENMGMVKKMAMKKVMKMSPEKREELFKKAMNPKNIKKNKKEILDMVEQMQKSGQINKHQAFEIKKRFGLL